MSLKNKTFTISIPTDQGFLGQICPSEDCGKYFKINDDQFEKIVFCPYCGVEIEDADLLTPEQQKYINDEAERVATNYVIDEIDKMFSNAFRGNKYIKYSKSPSDKIHRRPTPPKEQKVDSEISCPDCGTTFQVYGIFGYCPTCRSENIMIYEANLTIIKKEIESTSDKNRALRHAYNDLVSTFETICGGISEKHGLSSINFQSIQDVRKHFKKSILKIDIINGITEEDYLALRRIFQKRHVNIHNNGIINETYVKMIPQDKELHGKKVILSLEEFNHGAHLLRSVINNLI